MHRAIGTGALMALLLLGGCGRRGPDAETKGAGEALATVAPLATPSKRLVYPWSVVAGGVDSGAALRRAAEEDPTVAAHYDGMQLERFEARRLQADRKGYVSYRVRDRVYWTRRMVTLRAGEEVLTDGRAMIRGRCGNRVSETPQLPVADAGNEPAEAAMDEPVRGAQLLTSPAFPGEAAAGPAGPAGPAKPQQPAGEALSVLPAAGNSDALPPVWVNGGTGVLLGGGAPGSSATPTGSTPAPTGGGVAPVPPPGAVIVAQGPPLTGLEIPPPLVSTPLVGPPLVMNPPPGRIPPPGNSPPSHLPPGSLPPAPPPPGSPPPMLPPVPVPEGNPPPTSPLPPTGNPPPGTPPPTDPPLPPPGEPPVSSVPEPGAWVLAAIGLAGIGLGAVVRRMRGSGR